VKYVDSTIQNIILQVVLRVGKFACIRLRLKRVSAAVLLLGLQVQIMLWAWMLVSLFVCVTGCSLIQGCHTGCVCNCVWSRNLENEAA